MNRFWQALDQLVQNCSLVIDRPRHSTHPRFPTVIYPLDYGYLDGTVASDGDGIDVWRGSLPEKTVTGAVCAIDLLKRDVEVKILLGCDSAETDLILRFHNRNSQSATLIQRPANL